MVILRWLAGSTLLGLAYYGSAEFGLRLATVGDNVSPVWPASGIALAGLWLFGLRLWPGIFLAAMAVNLAHEVPWGGALGIAVGNTMETIIACFLLRTSAKFDASMERASDVFALATLGCLLSCAVAASVGSLSLGFSGVLSSEDIQTAWWVWLTGNAMGMLVVAPLLLTWFSPREKRFASPRQFAEFLALLGSTVIVCWALFTWTGQGELTNYPFTIIPFVLWAAVRFGPRGATAVTLIIAAFGVWGTSNQLGFFAGAALGGQGEMREAAMLLQIFLAGVAATGLLLGALTAERRRTETRLRDSEQRYRMLFESNPQAMWVHDRDSGDILAANDAAARRLGFSRDDFLRLNLNAILPPQGRGEAMVRMRKERPPGVRADLWTLVDKNGGQVQLDLFRQAITFDGKKASLVLAEDVTERMRAEENLRKSEQKLSLHIEQTAIGVIEWDRNFRVVEWNPAAEKIFGICKEDAAGKCAIDLVVPEDLAEELQNLWTRICLGKHTVQSYNDNLTADGRRIKCEWFNTPLIGRDGEVMGVASLVQDVTARERGANALRESEAKFRTVIESSPMGIHLFELQENGDLVLIGANPACQAIFGEDHEKALGKPITEALPALAETRIPQMYRETAIEGKSWWTDQVVFDKDQIVGAFEVNAFQSVPGKMVAMYLDVTERRRAEEALRLRDKAMDAITQGIIITDNAPGGKAPIIYANPAFEIISGYPKAELLGRGWHRLTGEETDPAEVQAVEHALSDLAPCSVEMRCYRRDGTSFLCSLTLSPIPDAEGRVTHFVWVFTDVTAIKHLEVQFRQAQKMEAIGRLAGGVAHDFNNLLTAIIGYNDLMLSDLAEGHPLAEHANEIRKASERAAALTGQLLAFSRQQTMLPQKLDLNHTIRGMEKMLARLIGENIRIETDLAENIGLVKAQSTQIEQVIMNLAINARDAMPEGGTLAIHTANRHVSPAGARPELPEGDYVELFVADTGMGMDESVREHLFEPFFTTKAKGKGTGLGLATCYGIIAQSGGQIRVESAPRRGTRFEIFLPRIERDLDSDHAGTENTVMPPGTETLLVVEDDIAVRPLTTSILRSLGYTVLEAENGIDAKKRIAEHSDLAIDLVVTDVVMPAMGGKELADWLRKNHPDTKILFTSGYIENALSLQDLGHGESRFLQKPFTPLALATKVRQVLDNQR